VAEKARTSSRTGDVPGRRTSGAPPSANGASSLHLWWSLPPATTWQEVLADLEVVRPPAVTKLHFWALQVTFADHGRPVGAAHTGLQWHPGAPRGAVNWGGYREGPPGGELAGSKSGLAPVDGPNTFHYPWSPGVNYRFRIWSPAAGAWRATVTDVATGITTVTRDLFVPAASLLSPVVWSEIFARCDDPATEVRWSRLRAVDASGEVATVTTAVPTYQAHSEGGCANTESLAGKGYFAQLAGLDRPRGEQPPTISLA